MPLGALVSSGCLDAGAASDAADGPRPQGYRYNVSRTFEHWATAVSAVEYTRVSLIAPTPSESCEIRTSDTWCSLAVTWLVEAGSVSPQSYDEYTVIENGNETREVEDMSFSSRAWATSSAAVSC